jgi:hypothetical protein
VQASLRERVLDETGTQGGHWAEQGLREEGQSRGTRVP